MIYKGTRILLSHFLQLAFLKGISRILPLVTLPFLMRTIGVEKYGTLEFVKSISFYFTTFIGYGFRYSATKEISQHKQDKATIGQVLGAVYTIQLVAIAAALAVMGLLVYLVPSIQQVKSYFLCFFFVVMASTLFPIFIFQGLEKMKWATLLNLITKLLYLASIFTLIRGPSDAILVPILLAITDTLRLAMASYLVYYSLGITIYRPTWAMIYAQLQAGWHIFLSQLSIIFYTPLPAITLGFFIGPSSVAIYALAEQIVKATVTIIEPFAQALFPIANRAMAQSLRAGFRFVGKIVLVSIVILLMISTSYWLLAPCIIQLLAGKPIPDATYIFRLHAFLPCIITISTILGIGALVPAGAGSKYTMTLLMTGLICAGLHLMLVPQLQAKGAAWAMLICETFSAVMIIFWTLKTYRRATGVKIR